MGNRESIYEREMLEHDFVGRESDIETLRKYLHSDSMIKVLTLFGMMKIGKSRLVKQLIIQKDNENGEEFMWCYIDFNDSMVDTVADIYCCIENLLETLDIPKTRDDEEPQIVKQGKCLKCKQNGETDVSKHCDHLAKHLKQLINIFKETTNKFDTKVILCLDNADDVIESGLKDIVQSIIKDIGKGCKNVKIVLTSTHKIGFTDKCCKVYELGPLKTSETVELIHIVTDHELLPEDYKCVEAIAKLCDGMPSAAIMAGSELKADDYLYSPSDMVEILIMGRLSTLSPDIYMADDRLDNFKEPIKKVEHAFKDCLNLSQLNENLSGDEFYIDQILEIMSKESQGSAIKLLKPWIEHYVVTVKHGRKKQFCLSGVFRECLSSLQIIEDFDNKELHETVLKIMAQNANTVGINCDNETLKCPKKVAMEVERLRNKEDHIYVENESEVQMKDGPTFSKEALNSSLESTVENVTLLSLTKKPGSGNVVYTRKAVEHSLTVSGPQLVLNKSIDEDCHLKEYPRQAINDPDTNLKYPNSLNIGCFPETNNGSMWSIEQQGHSAMNTLDYKIQNIEPQSPEFLPRGEGKLNESGGMVDFKPSSKCYRYVPVQSTYTNNQDQPLDLTLQPPNAFGASSQNVVSSTNNFDRSNSPLDLTMKNNNRQTMESSTNSLDRIVKMNTCTSISYINPKQSVMNGYAQSNSMDKTRPNTVRSTEGMRHVEESKANQTQQHESRNNLRIGQSSHSATSEMPFFYSRPHSSSESCKHKTNPQSTNNLEISDHSYGPEAMSYVSVDRLTKSNVSCSFNSRRQLEGRNCILVDSLQGLTALDLVATHGGLNNLNNTTETPKIREKILNIP